MSGLLSSFMIKTSFLATCVYTLANLVLSGPQTLTARERRPRLRLSDVSIDELLHELQERRLTSVQLVEMYIDRTQEVNSKVHAISEINPDALAIARERDIEREKDQIRGILHGVPILLKDVISTTDSMATTAGFEGLLGAKPALEATVVRKLREEGAIILGKATMSEWLNFRSPGIAPNGWSPVGGQCAGIFCENQDAGGSSTGSAVATALGLAAAALGTETSGSIATPARSCGLIGLKPTAGLTSRDGVFIANEYQDSVGVLSQTVKDAALILTAIADTSDKDACEKIDPRDLYRTIPPIGKTNFTDSCTSSGLKGLRIAVARHVMKRDEFATEKFEEALITMKSLGATIVDNVEFSSWTLNMSKRFGDKWKLASRLLLKQTHSPSVTDIESFLESFSENPQGLHTLDDVRNYTRECSKEKAGLYQLTELDMAAQQAQKYDMASDEYQESLLLRLSMGKELGNLLDHYKCDLLVAPAWTETAANVGGCPQVSVPLQAYPKDWPLKKMHNGFISTGPNIPTGILFVGRRWDDARVIGASYAFEQATHYRRTFKPIICPSADFHDIKAML
ncbi:hypothetical protein N7520_008604 [Penicillium odoratum]|uniref:uncharacterized protein n=1 Tax=Penicillium odoratum TaxID=1167516 RepID=UPI0025467FEF|nr:uncharacterized protein N7520_008604 [Penicillium odoratum]KAJ5751687.1 hypothetical protein N7520_008604 [Penicillium odoratum]